MRKLVLILVIAMFSLAGCGDEGGGDVDVASEKKAGGAPGEKDSGFTGKGGKNFCEYLEELEDKQGELQLKGDGSDADQEKAKKGLTVLEEIEDKAPAELKSDVVIVLEQVRPIFQAIADGKEYKPDPADQPTEAEAKEFEAAGKRVETYSTEVCGIKGDEPPADGSTGGSGGEAPADGSGGEAPADGEQAPADENAPPEG